MAVALPEPTVQVQFAKLQQETPSTNRFFRLAAIVGGQGKEFHDFRSRLCALTGVPATSHAAKSRGRKHRGAAPSA